MFRDGDGMATTRMPDIWGTRMNPIAGILPDVDLLEEDDDDDSLGNLSEFEDADFEVLYGQFTSTDHHLPCLTCFDAQAFADSLLDDHAEESLFGYDKGPANASLAAAVFKNPPDLDSLSDFENDSDDEIAIRSGGTLDRPTSTAYTTG